MNLFSLLTHHTHYWGIPHERLNDKRLIQICFVCGAEREFNFELRRSRTLAKPQTVVPKMRGSNTPRHGEEGRHEEIF
jgi:hypothetical protein